MHTRETFGLVRTVCFGFVLASLALLFAGPVPSWAADTPAERRHYRVAVDGTDRGRMLMKISVAADGSESMESETEVIANYLVYKYQYTSRGIETWKAGRLQKIEGKANYNGKVYQISGAAQDGKIRLNVNRQERMVRGDVWPTSYWKLPADARKRKELALIDADKGHDIAARMQFVANETVAVEGRRIACEHYRLSGAVQVDLWYDAEQRLVRQESIESGHKTTITLQRTEATAAQR
ncbi:MAG TPA: DUF6134 family protein [Planctomycetaceae bacterium]|nr:DUF6134 family protein [Planctomycetaceae bacterium]